MYKENWILYTITFMWFCSIIDFLLLLPLGTEFMSLYQIQPKQYGWLIASYSISGGISAFLAAFYIDKLDRKHFLLTAFFLFATGSLICSYAESYQQMMYARLFTGVFGGLLGGISVTIISDIFPYARRGRAMGILNMAFGLASILGIPFSIYISNIYDGYMPFRIIAYLSYLVLIPAYFIIPSMNKHISKSHLAVREVLSVLKNKNIQRALSFAFFLVLGHFMFISFINPYLIDNLGFTKEDTIWMYIVGGISVSLTSPRIGKYVDIYGKLKSFNILILLSFIPIIVISHIDYASIITALIICAFLFIFNSGRMVAAMTLITGAPEEHERGKFLVIRSSIIEISEGIAASIGGLIITQNPETLRLSNYNIVGYIAVILGIFCIYLARRITIVEKSV